MPSILDKHLNDVPDLSTVAPGEYTMQFESAEISHKKDDETRDILRMRFSIEGEPNAYQVNHYLSLPSDSDSNDDQIKKLRRLKDMSKALHIDSETFMNCIRDAYTAFQSGADQDGAFAQLNGYTLSAILSEEEYNGTMSNKIARLLGLK